MGLMELKRSFDELYLISFHSPATENYVLLFIGLRYLLKNVAHTFLSYLS